MATFLSMSLLPNNLRNFVDPQAQQARKVNKARKVFKVKEAPQAQQAPRVPQVMTEQLLQ